MTMFHLAVPVNDLKLTKDFYTKMFGADIGREYENYVVFNFFGHQLVCHQDPKSVPKQVSMYPRHYGIILDSREQFDTTYESCKQNNCEFFEDYFERFQGEPGWHHTFFVIDPSNNLIEVKYYENQADIY